jgi:hypothetical protein
MVGKGKTVKMVAARMPEARNEAVPSELCCFGKD